MQFCFTGIIVDSHINKTDVLSGQKYCYPAIVSTCQVYRNKPLDTGQVMIYTLGHLYEQGKISSGLGANVLGCDRWEFYRLLSDNGFSVIDYADDELADEAETSRKLAGQVQAE